MKFIKHNNNTGLLSLSIKIAVFVLILLSISSNLYAQTGYTLLEPLPCIPGGGVECEAGTQITSPNFETYVQYIFNLAIALAAVASVFMIVWGGFQYMSTDSFSGKSEGLKKVQNAIYGLLLILCSYLILKTIDPRLVELPSTLVAPLKLDYDKKVLSDFFNQLAAEASKYRIETAESAQKRDAAKSAVLGLEQQLGELLYDQGIDEDDPRVWAIKFQINKIKSVEALEQAKSGIAFSIPGSYLNSEFQPTDLSLSTIKEQKATVEKFYLNGLNRLTETGDPEALIPELNNYYYEAYASLLMQEHYRSSNNKEAIKNINLDTAMILNKMTDQKRKDNVIKQRDNVLKLLNQLEDIKDSYVPLSG